jgi:hypothetical protein
MSVYLSHVHVNTPSSHNDLFQQACDIESSVDNTYVVSAQSPAQRKLISEYPTDIPLYVEGGFTTWLRDMALTYFVLRGEQTHRSKVAYQKREKPSGRKTNKHQYITSVHSLYEALVQ